MKTNNRLSSSWITCFVAVGISIFTPLQAQQISFDHLNAGALGTNQNDKLVWANGPAFAASSGYYYLMGYSASGTYAGYYNSSPTLTVLSASTLPSGLPPSWSSFIDVKITLISAPIGGTFAYWTNALGPTFSLGVGDSTPLIAISDLSLGAGSLGGDPFGHIHGRRFTTTLPGDYLVDLRLFDVSINGLGGGSIHAPSDAFLMNFRTVPEPSTATLVGLALGGIWVMRISRRRFRYTFNQTSATR